MANFFVAGRGSPLALQALYTFWRFQKISQKVLRMGPIAFLTPRLEFDLKFHRVCEN